MAGEVDLFLDSLIDAAIKDDRALMEYPFFSLQKQPRMTPMVYDDGKAKIQIDPGSRGIATIWDKDVLIYLASVLNDRIERGLQADKTLRVAAYDVLRVTGRHTGKTDYELLLDALYRLRSTTITTTIKSADQVEVRGFGWIDSFRVVVRDTPSGGQLMEGLEVSLSDWVYRAVVKERRVLTINREYFKLTKGLERRLYELARKHCGRQEVWRISVDKLAMKCGTTRDTRRFKYDLKKIISANRIPDYTYTHEVEIDSMGRVISDLVFVRPKPVNCIGVSRTPTRDIEDAMARENEDAYTGERGRDSKRKP